MLNEIAAGATQPTGPQHLRQLTADCWVAGQIELADLEPLQRMGFKTIINNRPDNEVPNQPTHAQLCAQANALGLTMVHVPLAAGTAPSAALLQEFKAAFGAADKPVLAFCRSGTRSSTLYAASCGDHHD